MSAEEYIGEGLVDLPTNSLEGSENGRHNCDKFENTEPVQAESQPQQLNSAGEVEGMDTQQVAQEPEENRKLFIGGLHTKTNNDSLKTYFEQFGTVSAVDLKIDTFKHYPSASSTTCTRHRGFAFVTMANTETVDKILSQSEHFIDDKVVDVKRALSHTAYQAQKNRTKKVFVGGVPPEMTEETLQQYFVDFGEIEEVALVTDKETRRRRGFVFVTFRDYESVDKCTEKSFHHIGTCQVEVKRATPREDSGYSGPPGRGGRGRPMRGGVSRGRLQPYGNATVYGGYAEPGYYNDGGYYDPGYGGGHYGGGGGRGAGGYGSRYGPMKGTHGGANRGYHPYGR